MAAHRHTNHTPSRVTMISALVGLFAGALVAGGYAAGAQTPQPNTPGDRRMTAIAAPQPSGCITAVSPGEHIFTCDDLTYVVVIDERCTRLSCGVILDIHGAGMSARSMRDATELHKLAPRQGYLVVHPSARPENEGGSWDLARDPARMRAFVDLMTSVFHVDRSRIHITGFSMGAAMTFAFLCHHTDILASTAVVTGSSADQVRAPGGDRRCIEAIDAAWRPRVPIFFMNGVHDPALTRDAARARTEGIVSRLGLTGGTPIAGDAHYTRRRWTGEGDMTFDFLEHDYSTEGMLGGHCMPRGSRLPGAPDTLPANGVVCTTGSPTVHWGELALQWFAEHPKR